MLAVTAFWGSAQAADIDNTCASCSRRLLDSLNYHAIHPIRVNQVGYRTVDSKKTAFVAATVATPKSDAFQVIDSTGKVAYSGNLKSLGKFDGLKARMLIKGYYNSINVLYTMGDSTVPAQAEYLWKAEFGGLTKDGLYRVVVANDTSLPFGIRETVYNDVFETSLKFFGAQRCGNTDSWFHKACHTKDGSALGSPGELHGGWHDCGDHGKYGETVGYAATMLALAYTSFPRKAEDRFGASYADTIPFGNDGVPDLLWEAKIGADYIYRLYKRSKTDGLIAKNDMYHSVGNGPGMDHLFWDRPEYQDAQALNKGGPDRPVTPSIGGNVAGMFITSLALVGAGWEPFDPVYAKQLRDAAIDIYDNVLIKKRFTKTSEPCCYDGGGQVQDDPAMAAVSLWYATGQSRFGYDLFQNKAYGNNPGSVYSPGMFAAGFLGNGPIVAGGGMTAGYFDLGGWTTDFQQSNQLALYAFGKLILKDSATAAKYGIGPVLRDSLLLDVVIGVKRGISIGSNGSDKTSFPGINVDQPYHGVFTSAGWGFNRYNMGKVTELFLYWDLAQTTRYWEKMKGKTVPGRLTRPEIKSYVDGWKDAIDSTYLQIGTDNLNYQLGVNPWDLSFVMGAGSKNLQHPHNRAANPEGYNAGGVPYAYKVPEGALMGGCKPGSLLKDYWLDYTVTETCIDFSAQLIFPTLILSKDLPPDNEGPLFQNVTVVQVSDSSAIITWQTNELSRDTLFYSIFPNGPAMGHVVVSLAKNKSVTLTGLQPNTTYYFRFKGMDIYRNETFDDNRGRDYQFKTTTKAVPPPKIFDIKVCNIRADRATVFWWTDVVAPSAVEFAPEAGNFATTKLRVEGDDEGIPGRFHKVTLKGLKPGTAYRYDVISGLAKGDSTGLHHRFVTTPDFADYTIQMKATKKNYTTSGQGAHFYLLVANNEPRPYVGLELRVYFKADATTAKSIVVHSSDNGIFGGGGTMLGGPVNLTFGTAQPYGTSGNVWYLPITLKDTLPVSGSMRIELKMDNSNWNPIPFSTFKDGWSFTSHASPPDPKPFAGINMVNLWDGPEQIETRAGANQVTYVDDPYITAHFQGEHIYGYPPDGAKPKVFRTTAFRFAKPLPTPAVSVKQDSLPVHFLGQTWSFPDVVKADWQVDAPVLRPAAPLANQKDSIEFKHDTVETDGATSHEFAFWGDRDSTYCSCAWQRYTVVTDTMKAPPRKLTLTWDPTGPVDAWSGTRRQALKVSLRDSAGVLDTTVSVQLGSSSAGTGAKFWDGSTGGSEISRITLSHGEATLWVSDAAAEVVTLTASASIVGSTLPVASVKVNFQAAPPWPLIDSAWTRDSACSGSPSQVVVRLSTRLSSENVVTGANLILDGKSFPLAKDSIRVAADSLRIHLGLVPGSVSGSAVSGTVGLELRATGGGRDTSVMVTGTVMDRIGPRLEVARIMEAAASFDTRDTLYLQFSEAVRMASLPLVLPTLPNPATPVSMNAMDTTGRLWQLVVSPSQLLSAGMLVKASATSVQDLAGNRAVECADAVVLQQSWRPVPISGSTIRSSQDDGRADRIRVSFRRKLRAQDVPDSLQAFWGAGEKRTLVTAQGWIVSPDSLSLDASIAFPWGATSSDGSARSGVLRFFAPGALMATEIGLQDSVGVVLIAAEVRFGKDGATDTLKLTFSEPVDPASRASVSLNAAGNLLQGSLEGTGSAERWNLLLRADSLGLRRGDSLRASPRSLGGAADESGIANESSWKWAQLTFGPRPPVFLLEERNPLMTYKGWTFGSEAPLRSLVRSATDTSWSTLNGQALSAEESQRVLGIGVVANECVDGFVVIYDNLGTYVSSLELGDLRKACEEGKIPTDQGGRYEAWIAWDGRSFKREVVASGVYTLRLVTRRGLEPPQLESISNQLFRFGWKKKK
jgi:hypothetical protein